MRTIRSPIPQDRPRAPAQPSLPTPIHDVESSRFNPIGRIYVDLVAILKNQEKMMATLADIVAADAAVKTELDTITTGVTALVASNASLATQLAAAVAANDPVALQAAADAANALVTEGQAIVALLPTPPAP